MDVNEPKLSAIKNWSPDDRPREKLLLKGIGSLSDAELIAILIGTGTRTLSAVEVARQLLRRANDDLHQLARFSVKDLMKNKGIGAAKAITIVAALEIGRRRKGLHKEETPKLVTSQAVYDLLKPHLQDILHEEFWVVYLNRTNRVITKQQVSRGGVAGTVADPKIILKTAVLELASGIILAHNHPSGNLLPSQQDIELTKKIKEAGKLLEIQVLDHLIFGQAKYYSFADEGIL